MEAFPVRSKAVLQGHPPEMSLAETKNSRSRLFRVSNYVNHPLARNSGKKPSTDPYGSAIWQ